MLCAVSVSNVRVLCNIIKLNSHIAVVFIDNHNGTQLLMLLCNPYIYHSVRKAYINLMLRSLIQLNHECIIMMSP